MFDAAKNMVHEISFVGIQKGIYREKICNCHWSNWITSSFDKSYRRKVNDMAIFLYQCVNCEDWVLLDLHQNLTEAKIAFEWQAFI